jgi:thioredoxin-related protein
MLKYLLLRKYLSMKRILLTICISVFSNQIFAQLIHEKGIHIEHTSYNDAFAKAKKENKYFFIDCYTTWCGPCKMMANNTFTDDSVGRIFNHYFVSYKQDMEHNEGPELARIFRIEAYPTFLFIKPNGDIFNRAMGFMPPQKFIEMVLNAIGADANLDSLKAREQKRKLTQFELESVMLLSQRKHTDYEKYLNQYFENMPKDDWGKYENFQIMKSYSDNINSTEVQYLMKNKTELEKTLGKDEVETFIYKIAFADANSTDKKRAKEAQKILNQLKEKK